MFFSPLHKAVIYPSVINPHQLAATMDGAKTFNGSSLAVPLTLRNMQVARFFQLPVPALLDLDNYDFPIRPPFQPFTHQRVMASFMACHPRCLNLSDMGTGKTLSALWAADYLMKLGAVKSVLVLSPLSTLRRVWEDELFSNFLNRRTCSIVYGDRAERLAALRRPADFYILNHDGLGIGSARPQGSRGWKLGPVAAEIIARGDIGLVVVDEASAYKDSSTSRWKILRQVVEKKPYLWLLSGTPTPNAPTDAWALAKLVNPALPYSLQSFTGMTMYKVGTFKWLPRQDSQEKVSKALQPAIRYSRDECLDLPPVTVVTRDVPLSETQQKAYDTLKKELALTLAGGGQVTAVNEAVLRMKLIQVASGAVYGANREIHRTDAIHRINALIDVVEENAKNAKILVFASLTSVVELIYSELTKRFGAHRFAKVTGATSAGQRNEIFRRFEQEEDPHGIVADPGCMSHGLTLVQAATIVWFSPTERPETYWQANARINRPGQKRNMLVVRLASTKIEREIYDRLEKKESLQGLVLKLAEEAR